MALYNNGFPATYTPFYAPVQQQSQPSSQGGLIWVQGEAGAKSYLVAPNTTVALYDSENQTIYLKSADASGMPSMKILDYTIRDSAKNASNAQGNVVPGKSTMYATKEEIDGLENEIDGLRKQIEKLTKKMKEGEDE